MDHHRNDASAVVQGFTRGQERARQHLKQGPPHPSETERRIAFAEHAGYAAVMTQANIPPWRMAAEVALETTLQHRQEEWQQYADVWGDAYNAGLDAYLQCGDPANDKAAVEAELAVIRFLRRQGVALTIAAHTAERIARHLVKTTAMLVGQKAVELAA